MNQASTLADQGKLSEAEERLSTGHRHLYTQLIQQEARTDLIGRLAWVQTNAANTLRKLRRPNEAQALLSEAIPVLESEIKRTGQVDLQKVLKHAQLIQQQLDDADESSP